MSRTGAASGASEGRFLGSLLGLAIGDALGMPVAGWSATEIEARLGRVNGYLTRVMPDGTEIPPGEVTDESEISLAIIEALTLEKGRMEPETADNIGSRLVYLAQGDSARWLGPATREGLLRAGETLDFQVPLTDDGPATGDVAARGVAIGLLHSVGKLDEAALRHDTEVVTRLTHGSPAAIAAATAVAFGVQLAARGKVEPERWLRETSAFLGAGEMAEALADAEKLRASGEELSEILAEAGTGEAAIESVPAAFLTAMQATEFDEAVYAAVNSGGATDTVGAIAGALAGARFGDVGVPQELIDGLGCRIYVSLAGPWFYRAALQRAGLLIDLRPEGNRPPPRPTEPPRI